MCDANPPYQVSTNLPAEDSFLMYTNSDGRVAAVTASEHLYLHSSRDAGPLQDITGFENFSRVPATRFAPFRTAVAQWRRSEGVQFADYLMNQVQCSKEACLQPLHLTQCRYYDRDGEAILWLCDANRWIPNGDGMVIHLDALVETAIRAGILSIKIPIGNWERIYYPHTPIGKKDCEEYRQAFHERFCLFAKPIKIQPASRAAMRVLVPESSKIDPIEIP